MTPEERELITGLFDRLAQANTQPKDPEAEQLIREKVAAFPSAAYLLAQSTLVMEHALTNAQSRISTLEEQLTEARAAKPAGGSFLSGLFGGGSQPQPPPLPPRPAPAAYAAAAPGAYAAPAAAAAPAGGPSFLSTALSTAAGVAGGALLFQGIENLMGHNPGPFAGASLPSGGVLPSTETTEIVNNYYDTDPATVDPATGSVDASSLGLDNDPNNPDDTFSDTGDFLSDNNDDGGGFDDSSWS